MSSRRRNQIKKKTKSVDFGMEEVTFFIRIISASSGALLIISLLAFLLTGRQKQTDVIYAVVISVNAIAFIFGTWFVKKYDNKE